MYAIVTKTMGVAHLGRFHKREHAEMSMKMNGISGEVVKTPPYVLADFTIQHEFDVFNLNMKGGASC